MDGCHLFVNTNATYMPVTYGPYMAMCDRNTGRKKNLKSLPLEFKVMDDCSSDDVPFHSGDF